MEKHDYSRVMQFFCKYMETNSCYGAMSQKTDDARARKLADAFALALVAAGDVTQILEVDLDPENAYYDIFKHVLKNEFKGTDSNEVVEATMALLDAGPHELP